MLNPLDRLLRGTPPALLGALCVALVGTVAALDHLTGYELSFSIFYLIPVSIAAWYLGRRPGVATSVLSAVVWLAVDLTSGHQYTSWVLPFWNAAVRFGFFFLVARLLASLEDHLATEREMARVDGLTGVMSGRAFREAVAELIRLAARNGRPLVLAYIDLDNFKAVNDSRGHAEGDRALLAVASTLTAGVRRSDLVGRLGGDEFAVLLPETDAAGGREVLDKVRLRLAEAAAAGGWPIGFSIGAAVFSKPPKDPEEAIARADSLMYTGKRAGKDRTVLFEVSDVPASGQPGEEA